MHFAQLSSFLHNDSVSPRYIGYLRSTLYFPLIYFALNAANCASSNDIPSPWK